MNIFIHKNGTRKGPYSTKEIKDLIVRGDLSLSDKAWHEGCAKWTSISELPDLLAAVLPPLPKQETAKAEQPMPLEVNCPKDPTAGTKVESGAITFGREHPKSAGAILFVVGWLVVAVAGLLALLGLSLGSISQGGRGMLFSASFVLLSASIPWIKSGWTPISGFRGSSILRDVATIFGLTALGGILAVFCFNGKEAGVSAASFVVSDIFFGTLGFIISGCRAVENRWRHLALVAVGVWIAGSVFNSLLFGWAVGEWVINVVYVAIMMGTGCGVSMLIKRT